MFQRELLFNYREIWHIKVLGHILWQLECFVWGGGLVGGEAAIWHYGTNRYWSISASPGRKMFPPRSVFTVGVGSSGAKNKRG